METPDEWDEAVAAELAKHAEHLERLATENEARAAAKALVVALMGCASDRAVLRLVNAAIAPLETLADRAGWLE